MIVLVFSFSTIYALDDYTVLAPLPGITKSGDTTDLQTYLPAIFNLSIGIGAVLAFVMITFGGIMYATSDSITGKNDGRKYVEDAIWGLILVIGAYAILFTINPDTLKFSLNPDTPGIANTTQSTGTLTPDCPTCVLLSSLSPDSNGQNPTGIPVKAGLVGKLVTPELGVRLIQLRNHASWEWYVTEAFPPTVPHQSKCHYNGTCFDANLANPTIANIKSFISTASGYPYLNAFYEVKTQDEADSLIRQGVSASNIIVNSGTDAPHFHVIMR